MKSREDFIIGIDEVGRGALAGPVMVAAAALPKNFKLKIQNFKLSLKDSKKLSPKQRDTWFDFIKLEKIPFAVSSVFPKIIDKINISNAANLAATKALKRLINDIYTRRDREKCIQNCKIYLDGGLYVNNFKFIPRSLKKNGKQKFLDFKIKTIIKGDEKIPAISLASIVAKVSRDRLMKKEHKKYPRYDFIRNVGYGVKKHAVAIKKYGRSPIHRRSFKTPVA